MGVDKCQAQCLDDCSCTAYSFNSSGCFVWNEDLLNLRELASSDVEGADLYVRLSADSNNKSGKGVLILAIAGSSMGLVAALAIIWVMIWRHRRKLQVQRLGRGSFGSVYKGVLPDSSVIAVKKLEGLGQGEKEFRSEVADFGMAKLVGRDFSRVLTSMRGTMGYLAPEWIQGVPIAAKADVYSYGMMVLEIISGCRNSHQPVVSVADYFPIGAANKIREGDVLCLLDPRLNGDANVQELDRASRVACWCIPENEESRLSMRHVVLILEGVLEVSSQQKMVVEAVEERVPVIVDGGVQRRTDVFKALALGAQAVMIGRPVVYGLAADGENGVKRVLEMLKDELVLTMALTGCPSLKDITRSHVQTERDKWRSLLALALYSMANIYKSILITRNNFNIDDTDALFKQLHVVISDILGACLADLPRALYLQCHNSSMEAMDNRVMDAARLLGGAENILKALPTGGLEVNEGKFVERWRSFMPNWSDLPCISPVNASNTAV
ncbi:hypothetical protein ACLOJK_038940 [Asimina triloba]